MNSILKTLIQAPQNLASCAALSPLFARLNHTSKLVSLSACCGHSPSIRLAAALAAQGLTRPQQSSPQSALFPAQTLHSFTKGSFTKAQTRQPLQYEGQAQQERQAQQIQAAKQTAHSPARKAEATLAMAEAPKPAQNLPPIPIRVAIAIDASNLAIATSDAGVIVDQNGRVLGKLDAQKAVVAMPSATGLQVGDWQTPSVVWVKPRTAEGLVYVGEHWYRGSVQLIQVSGKLLAINYLDLESYLYSVVGSEMPAYWPAEALKAQAIAARSYAVVHLARPSSDYYDLGATPRWQAYNGAETETNTTQQAVNETRGLLLSYQGGVVESLYASSDQLVQEAHGGFGMSQEGASQLAQQSFSYQQILGHFYPGTGLAVLNIH